MLFIKNKVKKSKN